MGPGSPIYFDMESYSQTSSATAATLAFLEAWTAEAARARLRLRRLQQQRLRDRGPRRPGRQRLRTAGRPLDRQLERPAEHRRPGRPGERLDPAPAHPPVPRRPQRDLRRGDDQHRQQLRRRRDRRLRHPGRRRQPGRLPRPRAVARPRARSGSAAGPSTRTRRPNRWRSASRSAARRATPGVATYELGAVATRSRRDVAAEFPEAGRKHGFDLSLPTIKSGRQRVCAYALNIASGEDRLLGCKGATIPVALRLSNLKAERQQGAGAGQPASGRPGPNARARSSSAPASGSPPTPRHRPPHAAGQPRDRPHPLPPHRRRSARPTGSRSAPAAARCCASAAG